MKRGIQLLVLFVICLFASSCTNSRYSLNLVKRQQAQEENKQSVAMEKIRMAKPHIKAVNELQHIATPSKLTKQSLPQTLKSVVEVSKKKRAIRRFSRKPQSYSATVPVDEEKAQEEKEAKEYLWIGVGFLGLATLLFFGTIATSMEVMLYISIIAVIIGIIMLSVAAKRFRKLKGKEKASIFANILKFLGIIAGIFVGLVILMMIGLS